MKKISLALLIALPTGIVTDQYKSTFQKDWKTVNRLIDKSLPKSVLKKMQSIYKHCSNRMYICAEVFSP